jgi:bifunctional DNA-binding transcriptional regulator/antitoxin component of YhaV-PrlF toxin-antitoxin module
MAKVTSKLQITLPRRIAERYRIAPGHAVEFQPAGEVSHLVPPGRRRTAQLSRADVRAIDPFLRAAGGVNALPSMYSG